MAAWDGAAPIVRSHTPPYCLEKVPQFVQVGGYYVHYGGGQGVGNCQQTWVTPTMGVEQLHPLNEWEACRTLSKGEDAHFSSNSAVNYRTNAPVEVFLMQGLLLHQFLWDLLHMVAVLVSLCHTLNPNCQLFPSSLPIPP
eukprot:gene4184-6530_t